MGVRGQVGLSVIWRDVKVGAFMQYCGLEVNYFGSRRKEDREGGGRGLSACLAHSPILFSPSLALWMIARPVTSPWTTCSLSTPTPPWRNKSRIQVPSSPILPSRSTDPPALATAKAWLAPLPPGLRVNAVEEIVSPGLTIWGSEKNSSTSWGSQLGTTPCFQSY